MVSCRAWHCCSFECITGVKCGVQDGSGSDAVTAAAIGKGDGRTTEGRTDCSCKGIPFIQEGEGDRRGDGRTDGGERERKEI